MDHLTCTAAHSEVKRHSSYTFRIARYAREPPAVAICALDAYYEGGRFKPCTNVMGFDLAYKTTEVQYD